MACKIENIRYKGKQLESRLGEQLINIFNDLDEAQAYYDSLSNPDFLEKFGDWVNEDIEQRTNEDGEPLIIDHKSMDGSMQYYIILANGERFDIEVREFSSFTSPDLTNEIKEITDQLVYYIYGKHFNKDFSNLDDININIGNEIESFLKYKESISDQYDDPQELLDYVADIRKHANEFESEIVKFFNERKINVKEDEIEDLTQDHLEQGLVGGDIIQSFEKNSKDNATANVKMMLSFLPKINNLTGEPIVGEYLGDPLFRSFDAVHKELQTELSDITNFYLEGKVSDVYDLMYAKIKDLAKNKKSYDSLIRILDNVDENKRTEFVQAFYLSKVNFFTTTYDQKNYGMMFTMQNVSNVNNPVNKKRNEYNVAFRSNNFDNNKMLAGQKKHFEQTIARLLKNATKNKRQDLSSNEDFYIQFADDIAEFKELLNDLGLTTFTAEAMDLYLKKFRVNEDNNIYKVMHGTYMSSLINLTNLFSDISKGKIDPLKQNIFKEYSNFLFDSLAKAELYFTEDMGDSTIYSNGKTYWTFARPSYLNNRINSFKRNPKLIKQLLNDTYSDSSVWARFLLGEEKTADGSYRFGKKRREANSEKRLEELELATFNSFQQRNRGKDGKDNKRIKPVDQLIDQFNKVMKGSLENTLPIYSTSTPADKSRMYEVRIDHFIKDTVHRYQGNSIIFSDEILNIFTDYVVSEIERMKIAYYELGTLDRKDLKLNYHTSSNGTVMDDKQRLVGNAFRLSHIISELSPENINPETNDKIGLYNSDYSPKAHEQPLTQSQIDLIRGQVANILESRVKDNFEELQKRKIILSGGNEVYDINTLDYRVAQEYRLGDRFTRFEAMNVAADFTINSIIANIEFTKLFTGDPAYYKTMSDFFKRVPATYTDGTNLRLGITENDAYFNLAVTENVNVTSKYLDEIKKGLDQDESLTQDERDYVLDSYKNINQTDAQAWITVDRWAFLVSRSGKWNKKYAGVYEKIKNDKPLTSDELKYAAQPLKGVYFGLVDNRPVYLKYSQAVLLPQLTQGTALDVLRKEMEQNSIDETVVLDGIKVGASTPNELIDNEGNLLPKLSLNKTILQNADWKLQQDLPTKTMKPTLIGSQIQKNIFSSLKSGTTFQVGDKVYSDREMFNAINDIISSMSNLRMGGLSSEIGKDSEGMIDKERFYEMLERELMTQGSPTNLLKSVQKNIPIEAIPGIKDKLYNIFFAKVNKAAIKLKMNGGSFIQLSNFGLDRITADKVGITWLTDPDSLRPPLIEQDAEGKKHIVPGDIFISHSQIATYIPNYRELSMSELNKRIDKRLLRAIGYRIPNQGQSSNDPLRIVGILPESMGDTIVGYTEIPTKTGSDFDIDKMYIMLPEFSLSFNRANYKAAKDYIKQADITYNEMLDQVIEDGHDMGELSEGSIMDNVQDLFIKEHLFKPGDAGFHEDFVKQYNIGDVSRIEYVTFEDNVADNNGIQLNNMLFEHYWSVLTAATSYGDLVTPVDFPHVKNKIKELFGDNSNRKGDKLLFHDPLYQLDLKFIYTEGKSGVGITANMLVDHNRSKFVNLMFNSYSLGIGHTMGNQTLFDREYSQELNGSKYKIRDTISAFLNAFVDNAKDPYIRDGNFNSYTSSVAFMLIRAGVHPDWIISFIGNPVLKELVEFTNTYESDVIPKDDTSKSSYDILAEKYKVDQLADVKLYEELDPEFFSLKKLQDDIRENRSSAYVLKLFKEYQEQAKKLNESVQLSRFDTTGAGKNLIDLIIFKNKLVDMYNQQDEVGSIIGHFEKYKKNDGSLTSLGQQLYNTVFYIDDILDNNPDLFLLGSNPIQDLLNDISNETLESRGGSKGDIKDDEIADLYFKEVYKYIMSDFDKFKIKGDQLEYIKDTIKDILTYKEERSEYETTNFFMDNLSIFENSFGIDNKNKSMEYADRLYRSAYDLMEEDPILADKIFISSFLMSGFETKLIDIKEYIPYQWFLRNGIRDFIRRKNIEFKDSPVRLQSFRDQFIKNNWSNNVIVPRVSSKITYKLPGLPEGSGFKLMTDSELHQRYILGKDKSGNEVMGRYLKSDNLLYELQGYRDKEAVYGIISKLGFQDKSSYLDMKEYRYDEQVIGDNDGTNTFKEKFYNWWNNELDNYSPSDSRIVEKTGIDIKTLKNILFSQNNVVSLQEDNNEDDFTKDDC